MATQQSLTNEQLEALCAENADLHKAVERLAGKRDSARRANVQLQLQSLTGKATLHGNSNALKAWCLQDEAKVEELKGKIDIMEWRGGYRESPTTTSATLGPYSYPALGGLGSGLMAQASPQLGGGMSILGVPQAPAFPPAGQGLSANSARPVTCPAGSTPLPSPRAGS